MPISTKEHSMNQLIKSYLQDKDPDDVDYDSVIKYVYSKTSHGGEKVNGMNIFKAKYQKNMHKFDAYVTNKEHNPMQDTIIVEDIDALNSTTVVDEENEQNDSNINSILVIDLCDDNIVEEHRRWIVRLLPLQMGILPLLSMGKVIRKILKKY